MSEEIPSHVRKWQVNVHESDDRLSAVLFDADDVVSSQSVTLRKFNDIIPGKAEMLFQFRDVEPERLAVLERTLDGLVAEANARGPCRVELEVVSRTPPHAMDKGFQGALEAAGTRSKCCRNCISLIRLASCIRRSRTTPVSSSTAANTS